MKINVEFNKYNSFCKDRINRLFDDYYCISIGPKSSPITEVLSNKNIKKLIENHNKNLKQFMEMDPDLCSEDDIIVPFDEDFNAWDYIDKIIISEDEESAQYIRENPILNDYEIYIIDERVISREDYEQLSQKFKGIPNLRVKLCGNSRFCLLSEYKETIEGIEKISNTVKKYDLSPIEQIMFAYDLVRNRVYKEVGENEDKSNSRNISDVLKGENIVCVGFQEIFSNVLNQLNISNEIYSIRKKGSIKGHVRTKVLVDDDKYDIHGVYYFDPTWDCKENEQDKIYQNRYKFFAMNREDMMRYDDVLYEKKSPILSQEMIDEFNKFLETKDLRSLSFSTAAKVAKVSNLFFGEFSLFDSIFTYKQIETDFGNDEDDCIYKEYKNMDFDNIKKMFETMVMQYNSTKIDQNKLMDAILKVRKVESYEFPEQYDFNHKTINSILQNSFGVNFEKRLLFSIFGYERFKDEEGDEIIKYLSTKNLARQEEELKLVKALRKVLESKR